MTNNFLGIFPRRARLSTRSSVYVFKVKDGNERLGFVTESIALFILYASCKHSQKHTVIREKCWILITNFDNWWTRGFRVTSRAIVMRSHSCRDSQHALFKKKYQMIAWIFSFQMFRKIIVVCNFVTDRKMRELYLLSE